MTVWLTPDREPFYGGTYFPPRDGDRGARIGLPDPAAAARASSTRRIPSGSPTARPNLARGASRQSLAPARRRAGLPDRGGPAARLRDSYAARFDAANGGFGGAPKFPRSLPLAFLLRYHRRSGDAAGARHGRRSRSTRWPRAASTTSSAAASTATRPTRAGWCRTSRRCSTTTRCWRVAYLEAYQVTGRRGLRARWRARSSTTCEREMTAPGGGFYSASDADSEGEEGTLLHVDAGARSKRLCRAASAPRSSRTTA